MPECGGSEPSSPFHRKSTKNSSQRSKSSSSCSRPRISGPTHSASSVHSSGSDSSSQAQTVLWTDVTPTTSALHMTKSTGKCNNPKIHFE